jgi:GTP-binding protein EngB required for normal cell division
MKKKFFILLLIISNLIKIYQGLTNAQVNRNDAVTILLLGQIRSGKSCFANSLFNKEIAQVGSEDGDPTTKSTTLYQDVFGEDKLYLNLIDTEGLDNSVKDLENLYSLSEFLHKNQTIAYEIKVDYIFLFLSLNSESKSLKSDIQKIKFIFGSVKGIEIILTKGDKLSGSTKKYLEEIYNFYQGEIAYPKIIINLDCNKEATLSEKIKEQIFDRINPNKKLKNVFEASEFTERLNKLDNFIKDVNTTLNSSLIDNLNLIYKEYPTLEKVDNDAFNYKYFFYKLVPYIVVMILMLIGKKYLQNFKNITNNFNSKFKNLVKDNKVNEYLDDNVFHNDHNDSHIDKNLSPTDENVSKTNDNESQVDTDK